MSHRNRKNPQNIKALFTQPKSIIQQVSLGTVVQALFHLKVQGSVMTQALRKISEHISSMHVVSWDPPLPSNANISTFLD